MKNRLTISFFLTGILAYIISITLGIVLFKDDMMPTSWIAGQFIVVIFFCAGVYFTYRIIINNRDRVFIRNLIWINIVLKFLILIFGYYYYKQVFGIPFFKKSDAFTYYNSAIKLANHFSNFKFDIFEIFPSLDFSDGGTILYYGFIYFIFGDNIFMSAVINLILLTHSVYLIYKIIRMIDNEHTARLTAIIFSFVPIFNKYIPIHLKEIVLVWLILLIIRLIIKMVESKRYSFLNILLLFFLIAIIFLFRTVLAYSLILSFLLYLLLRKKSKNDIFLNIASGSLVLIFISGIILYNPVSEETNKYVENAEKGGNIYIEKLSKNTRGQNSVVVKFLGLPSQAILAIFGPFPTLVNYKDEWGHKMVVRSLIADAYMKLLLGFLFFNAIFNLKLLRNNYLITSFLIINIFIIALSKYALNFRFHMPIFPFFIYFAVKGMDKINKSKILFFAIYFIFMMVLYISFNYNKLAELGLK